MGFSFEFFSTVAFFPDINSDFKFLVRLHGECNTSLALWKHHVNLSLQSVRSVEARIFISANNEY